MTKRIERDFEITCRAESVRIRYEQRRLTMKKEEIFDDLQKIGFKVRNG